MEKLKNLLAGMTIDVNTNLSVITINDRIHSMRHPDTILNLFLELKRIQSE